MKKKILCMVLAATMLTACGSLPSTETGSQQENSAEGSTENSAQESSDAVAEIFENEAWKEAFDYSTNKIDSLMGEITVSYEEYPAPYVYTSKNSGSENGGLPPYTVKYEGGSLIIEEDRGGDVDSEKRITLSDYRNDCFNKMVISKIDANGNELEVLETHAQDAFMKDFNSTVLKMQEEDITERENTRTRTDVMSKDASEEFGLSVIKEEQVGDYTVCALSNDLYANKTVYMTIAKEGYTVATITDRKALYDSSDEEHLVRIFNYEGYELYENVYELVGSADNWYESFYKYDAYGNLIEFEDICNLSTSEYSFSDIELTQIISKCTELL